MKRIGTIILYSLVVLVTYFAVTTLKEYAAINSDFENTAEKTVQYWDNCHALDHEYAPQIREIWESANHCNTPPCLSAQYKSVASLMEEWMDAEQSISIVGVDSELVDFFKKGRDYCRKEANIHYRLHNLYNTWCDCNFCDCTVLFDKEKQLLSDLQRLYDERVKVYDWDAMQMRLSQRYNRHFKSEPSTAYSKLNYKH